MDSLSIHEPIIHIPEGVCTVEGTVERTFSTHGTRTYYVLVPVFDRNTKIYVPTDGDAQKLRSILSREEVTSLIDSLPDCKNCWIENAKERQASFTQILSRFDREEMISLIRTLRDKRQEKIRTGKKFHSADEKVFREAERILFSEFGYVLGIQPGEVPSYIDARLGHVES